MLAMVCLSVTNVCGCYLSHSRDDNPPTPQSTSPTPDDIDAGLPPPPPPDAQPPIDAGPTDFRPPPRPLCPDGRPGSDDPISVTLAFIVDNSGSMLLEQERLSRAFPTLVETMLTGDLDGDGVAEFSHADSLEVRVRTTDMGSPTGRLCPVPLGGFQPDVDYLRLPASEAVVDAFKRRTAGMANVGDQGCIYEQTFEAVLDSVPLTDDSSVLSVVLVTDEDDCSVEDRALFRLADDDLAREEEMDPTGELRCFIHPGALFDVRHHARALRGLRPFPENVVVSAIAGIPPDLTSPPGAIDRDHVLRDPRMQQRRDPDRPWRLLASCTDEESYAEPPRRITDLVSRFGQRGSLQSICSEDWRPALLAIAERIGYTIENRRCSANR